MFSKGQRTNKLEKRADNREKRTEENGGIFDNMGMDKWRRDFELKWPVFCRKAWVFGEKGATFGRKWPVFEGLLGNN